MEFINEIQNSELVINHFSYWPSFHDSEIISINFERSMDKISSTAKLKVYVFEITNQLKGKYYKLIKRCLIEFEFIGVSKNKINNFNNQNVVYGLHFGKDEDGFLEMSINSTFGLDGFISSKKIKILNIESIE